jgi:hypothetical protein
MAYLLVFQNPSNDRRTSAGYIQFARFAIICAQIEWSDPVLKKKKAFAGDFIQPAIHFVPIPAS